MSQVISIQGPMGSHKSSMMLSWRAAELKEKKQKIRVYDLERGLHRALPFASIPEVIAEEWTSPPPDIAKLKEMLSFTQRGVVVNKRETWTSLSDGIVADLSNEEIGVIGIDTGKSLWETCHQGYLQELQEANPNQPRQSLQPLEYTTPNGRMKSLLDVCKVFGKDIIIVSHERDVYVKAMTDQGMKDVPSGEMTFDGWKETLDFVDWGFKAQMVKEDNPDSPFRGLLVPRVQVIKSPVGDHMRFSWLPEMTYASLEQTVMAMASISETVKVKE